MSSAPDETRFSLFVSFLVAPANELASALLHVVPSNIPEAHDDYDGPTATRSHAR